MLSNFQKTQTMANWLQLWKTLGFPIIYFRLWKIESEIPINQWSDGGGLPTRIIKNSHLQHGMYLSHYPQWLKIPWKCRIFISNPFYPHSIAFFCLFPFNWIVDMFEKRNFLPYDIIFEFFIPLCTENKASMRKVKEQMRPIRVLYSDTQHTHQMQILVKCKWDAILGDNIILLSRYALLFCMETFLFEHQQYGPHKNWGIAPFSVGSKSLCNPAVDHTKRLDTHTQWHFKQTNLRFGLGQSVGQTTNTSTVEIE